jgi:hypothetical protein
MVSGKRLLNIRDNRWYNVIFSNEIVIGADKKVLVNGLWIMKVELEWKPDLYGKSFQRWFVEHSVARCRCNR